MSGNEDVLYFANGLGVKHGVDIRHHAAAGRDLRAWTGAAFEVEQALRRRWRVVCCILARE